MKAASGGIRGANAEPQWAIARARIMKTAQSTQRHVNKTIKTNHQRCRCESDAGSCMNLYYIRNAIRKIEKA
eukprot:4026386-Amphidinium_carterae.1